mmetsp:Transcript_53004/g.133281  ORF Transcript_53004/g.133281 Transcript_53004/m.133281 type:complete len:222 (-) Transcript_53004:87-752(-)|eukprot:CAMPEP_0177664322 /NCGR_PEP_ID=MMETSP0447-20121125/20428_1 /TAXON_ID=0 /ORGANISM="Stygamoeba regulata, Strain BSH-02190019" /LENGTH=221 /DNA_ID=CAMNT_0019170279 /DNA_START=16 /DNA_END=681 /DNA_ORIENTATION=+
MSVGTPVAEPLPPSARHHQEPYDLLFKFIIIGDAGVGKSCLLHRFVENKFNPESTHTIGVEFGSRVIEVGGHSVKLQVWDTAGQERFRSVTRSYYRGAAGVLLVYDTTSRESYNHVATWLSDARALANPDIAVVLVGSKVDLEDQRQVTFMEATRFAQENGIHFFEGSALTGENVEEVFIKCARGILAKIDTGDIDPDVEGFGVEKAEPAPTLESRCCSSS